MFSLFPAKFDPCWPSARLLLHVSYRPKRHQPPSTRPILGEFRGLERGCTTHRPSQGKGHSDDDIHTHAMLNQDVCNLLATTMTTHHRATSYGTSAHPSAVTEATRMPPSLSSLVPSNSFDEAALPTAPQRLPLGVCVLLARRLLSRLERTNVCTTYSSRTDDEAAERLTKQTGCQQGPSSTASTGATATHRRSFPVGCLRVANLT